MRRIAEIARSADVSIETVLRVLHGDPVSEELTNRVTSAIEELEPGNEIATRTGVEEEIEGARSQLLETFAQAAAELEASLPQGLSSVVYEALRLEVHPISERMLELGSLLEQTMGSLKAELQAERAERLGDVEVLVDLMVTGWRSVDRRLGRIERALERLEANQAKTTSGTTILRLGETTDLHRTE
jgi:hypothetical protein